LINCCSAVAALVQRASSSHADASIGGRPHFSLLPALCDAAPLAPRARAPLAMCVIGRGFVSVAGERGEQQQKHMQTQRTLCWATFRSLSNKASEASDERICAVLGCASQHSHALTASRSGACIAHLHCGTCPELILWLYTTRSHVFRQQTKNVIPHLR
jgi:hypothetical protein